MSFREPGQADENGWVIAASAGDMAEDGRTAVFTFADPAVGGRVTEGFVVRHAGRLHAYRNVCRHVPLSLDYGDGDFLTEDHRFILCRNHGALFEPDTGRCVAGPCVNACLFSFPVAERDGDVVVQIPTAEEPGLELE